MQVVQDMGAEVSLHAESLKKNLLDKIEDAQGRNGITARMLATRSGLSYRTVQSLMSRRRDTSPTIEMLVRLTEAVGLVLQVDAVSHGGENSDE